MTFTHIRDDAPVRFDKRAQLGKLASAAHAHLDNDEVGRAAAIRIWEGLEGKYTVFNEPADEGCKDMNDQLKKQLGIDSKRKEVLER